MHITIPLLLAGAAIAGGSAVTATVIYTSGPLKGGDAASTAATTPSATAGTPTAAGTSGPCLPAATGGPPPPDCQPIPVITASPPPGVQPPGFTPSGPPSVIPPPPGFTPNTIPATSVRPPFGPTSFPTPDTVESTLALVKQALIETNNILSQLDRAGGKACSAPCGADTNPNSLWPGFRDSCANLPAAGFSGTAPSLWPPGYLALDQALRQTCNRIIADLDARRGIAYSDPTWTSIAVERRAVLGAAKAALPVLTEQELRAAIARLAGR